MVTTLPFSRRIGLLQNFCTTNYYNHWKAFCHKLEKRLEEQKAQAAKLKSAFKGHVKHNIHWENKKVLEREPRDIPSKILETIHIRTLIYKLNTDKGLELDPVWNNIFTIKGS